MRKDGIFTIHRYVINFQEYGKPIVVKPFGDVHRNSPNCHIEKWLEDCREWKDRILTGEQIYFLGMGDYNDLVSTSERVALDNPAIHDSTLHTFDDFYKQKTDDLTGEIDFMQGRTIGLVEGNHHALLLNGTTTTQRMCETLSCAYLGISSFVRLVFTYRDGHNLSKDLWIHHGLSGGRRVGTSINKVEDMMKIARADVYLMAHDHKKHIAMLSNLELTTGKGAIKLRNNKILLARTGSYLKAYEPNQQSYVVKRALHPADLGSIEITFTPTRKTKEGVDYRSIEIGASI